MISWTRALGAGSILASVGAQAYITEADELMESNNEWCTVSNEKEAAVALKQAGVAIIQTLPGKEESIPRKHIAALCQVANQACRERYEFRETSLSKNNRQKPLYIESTRGRFHRISFDSDTIEHINAIETRIKPYVNKFFSSDGSSCIYRSQCQLLCSIPGSSSQFFHQDNAAKGLTVVIPLDSVSLEMGPTQILPFTHKIKEAGTIQTVISSLMKKQSCKAKLDLGQFLLYDSRTLHRGMANNSEIPRPVLILRYDNHLTPPPGQTLFYTCMIRILGKFLHNSACFNKVLQAFFMSTK